MPRMDTPSKKEKDHRSSSSRKTKTKGLSQKEKDLLAFFRNDPEMQQEVLQKILQDNSDNDTASSAASSSPPKPEDFQDSQDPYEL